MHTRGGVASMVRAIRDTRLWDDWNVRHIATHRDGSRAAKIGTYLTALISFVREVLWHRPTVVHLHMSSYGSFYRKSVMVLISRALRIPVIVHMHGSEFHVFYDGSPRPIRRYIRFALESADRVVALGETWAQRISLIAPGAHVMVIPNAVRPGVRVAQPAAGDPVTALFLGNIGERKGAFVLLDAWADLMTEAGATPARLVLAGDGEVERAGQQVAELGIESSVQIRGWVDPQRLPDLLGAAQILVLPSRNEGQPMAILEAMARGLCVVASAAGGIPELIDEDCGVLVPVGNRAALTAALRKVIDDGAERKALGDKAWHRILSDFDADAIANRISDLYREAAR
ncbi:glycosyltransferase family 4 protein [Aldersonia kunmingensis]|uniref:glycosyltransferase family 4 protein n=1 Tax=Aldersonia kunmingensis TaxID=408066 RepID=UPI00082E5BE8|nr:glycosyltransferase family 4 protein [Aldersonia kunmingensis]